MSHPYRDAAPQVQDPPRAPVVVWDLRILTDDEESFGFGLWMAYMIAGALVPMIFIPRGSLPGWFLWYLLFHLVMCFLFPTLYWYARGLRKLEI